jgi:hypothetical protein
MICGRRPLHGRKLGDRRIPARDVARHWWDRVLYNQSAKRLKAAFVGREHRVIADVPYRPGAQ